MYFDLKFSNIYGIDRCLCLSAVLLLTYIQTYNYMLLDFHMCVIFKMQVALFSTGHTTAVWISNFLHRDFL